MTYNVTITLVFEAENEEDAMEKAEKALLLIPDNANVDYSEAHYADLNHN